MKVIIAAAGTGGHINPGIAIANKIQQEEPNSEIIFIGTDRGIENDLVPRAGYKLRTVEAYGLVKKLTPYFYIFVLFFYKKFCRNQNYCYICSVKPIKD